MLFPDMFCHRSVLLILSLTRVILDSAPKMANDSAHIAHLAYTRLRVNHYYGGVVYKVSKMICLFDWYNPERITNLDKDTGQRVATSKCAIWSPTQSVSWFSNRGYIAVCLLISQVLPSSVGYRWLISYIVCYVSFQNSTLLVCVYHQRFLSTGWAQE